MGVGEGRSKGGGIREGREGCGIGVEGGWRDRCHVGVGKVGCEGRRARECRSMGKVGCMKVIWGDICGSILSRGWGVGVGEGRLE